MTVDIDFGKIGPKLSPKPPKVQQLEKLAAGSTPTRVIGLKLGRTPEAVQQKASTEGISLKPTNQRPYGTKRR